MTSQYKTRKVAAPNTLEHRIYIEKDGVPVSPFHDIPLYANEAQTILNMVVEIPRWTNGKLEISKVRETLVFLLYFGVIPFAPHRHRHITPQSLNRQ
jgi:inorganic pyrophosphatase